MASHCDFCSTPGWVTGIDLKCEAVHLGAGFQQRDRLLAVGAVVIDEADLLALELVEAAEFLGDMLDGDVGGGPVGADRREVPGEDRAVAAFRAAIAHRQQRDLVARRLLGQRERDAGRERAEIGGAGRPLPLEALVALHALVGGVAGLALLHRQLDAVDAAIALVEHVEVVGRAVGERNAVGRIGAGAIDEQGKELLVLARQREGEARRQADGGGGEANGQVLADVLVLHEFCSCWPALAPVMPISIAGILRIGSVAGFNRGTATASASPWRVAHSRAKPCGSTISR